MVSVMCFCLNDKHIRSKSVCLKEILCTHPHTTNDTTTQRTQSSIEHILCLTNTVSIHNFFAFDVGNLKISAHKGIFFGTIR